MHLHVSAAMMDANEAAERAVATGKCQQPQQRCPSRDVLYSRVDQMARVA